MLRAFLIKTISVICASKLCYMEKEVFLQFRLPRLLQNLPANTPPLWGKMTLQQMTEHLCDAFKIASGKTPISSIYTPPEQLQKFRDFLMSEKPFRENTINPLLPQVPAPVKNNTIAEAHRELKEEIDRFFDVFKNLPQQTTRNPIFGDLNYEQNLQLLYKHALHHLKQFGVSIENQVL